VRETHSAATGQDIDGNEAGRSHEVPNGIGPGRQPTHRHDAAATDAKPAVARRLRILWSRRDPASGIHYVSVHGRASALLIVASDRGAPPL
jgi:hypothetical protein